MNYNDITDLSDIMNYLFFYSTFKLNQTTFLNVWFENQTNEMKTILKFDEQR